MAKKKMTDVVAPGVMPMEQAHKTVRIGKKAEMLLSSVLVQGEKTFLENMQLLEPRDYCNCYIKLLQLALPTQQQNNGSAVAGGVTALINNLSIQITQQP